ncbi:hypothetical protein [Paenibacillus sp. UNC499MF]|uniref:hypothetical protein n=1 Tax=Paenibacillus sp. UNC499MF TaxID=1502751 RepID=UPI000CDEA00C|nr:hypothetical protein [Paenibacillus sp. UNC499MF]
MSLSKKQFDELKEYLGIRITEEPPFGGIDYFLSLFEKIKSDSSMIIIKLDGEREENTYTVLVSGSLLGSEESIRIDTSNLLEGAAYIILEYAKRVWKWVN